VERVLGCRGAVGAVRQSKLLRQHLCLCFIIQDDAPSWAQLGAEAAGRSKKGSLQHPFLPSMVTAVLSAFPSPRLSTAPQTFYRRKVASIPWLVLGETEAQRWRTSCSGVEVQSWVLLVLGWELVWVRISEIKGWHSGIQYFSPFCIELVWLQGYHGECMGMLGARQG